MGIWIFLLGVEMSPVHGCGSPKVSSPVLNLLLELYS
jgi:hypothetical protein